MSNPLAPPKAGDTVEFRGRSWIVFKWIEEGGIAVISLTGGPKDSISIPWASLPRPDATPNQVQNKTQNQTQNQVQNSVP